MSSKRMPAFLRFPAAVSTSMATGTGDEVVNAAAGTAAKPTLSMSVLDMSCARMVWTVSNCSRKSACPASSAAKR